MKSKITVYGNTVHCLQESLYWKILVEDAWSGWNQNQGVRPFLGQMESDGPIDPSVLKSCPLHCNRGLNLPQWSNSHPPCPLSPEDHSPRETPAVNWTVYDRQLRNTFCLFQSHSSCDFQVMLPSECFLWFRLSKYTIFSSKWQQRNYLDENFQKCPLKLSQL